jgi:hypothetical protein
MRVREAEAALADQPAAPTGPGRRSASGRPLGGIDEALMELAAPAEGGSSRPPGAIYGRLRDVAYVSNPHALAAVNAVLAEVASLETCVVVDSRECALAVLEHLSRRRAGYATCKIASEAAPAAHKQARTGMP